MSAADLKEQGNEEFNKGNFLKAAATYTQAIKLDPTNAVLYSNRSASLLKLKKVTKALEDAEECIKLRPDWEKGYFRKGAVYEEQQQYAEALAVYQKAQATWPSNKELGQKVRALSKLVKVNEKQEKEDTLENFIIKAVGEGPVSAFCTEVFNIAAQSVAEEGAQFVPSLHFMPGNKAQEHDEAEHRVRATLAFSQPDFLARFVAEMREMAATRLDAQAVCAVVPKQAVSFPQVWTKPGWPCGKSSGVFVQLEAKGSQWCWFIPVYEKTPGKPHLLQEDFFIVPHKFLKS